MVQLLTTKYDKEEENILMASNVLGICVGAVVTVVTGYGTGLFSHLTTPARSPIPWTVLCLKLGLIMSPLSWIVTLGACVLFLRKENVSRSRKQIGRLIPGTLFLPLAAAYASVVMGLVMTPLYSFLLSYISPWWAMDVGLLAFLPFMILGIVIVLPDSPGGKSLRKSIHRLQRRQEYYSKQ